MRGIGGTIRLGRLFGIEIGLDYSWFIIFFFLTITLGYAWHHYWPSSAASWILGFLTSIIFFASILAHELAHSLVSQRHGIPVKSITLFIFGGVARITREPSSPGVEFKMALAGPLSSLGIGVFFWLITVALCGGFSQAWDFALGVIEPPSPIALMTLWLAWINGVLAVFNMIPGFPLDGGRVFRSLIWAATGSYGRATRIAYIGGRTVAYLFMAGGVVAIFMLDFWFNGLWFIFIGWILHTAAQGSYRQAKLRQALEPFTAAELMTRDYPSVSRGLSLDQLIENYFLHTGRRYFLVTEEDKLEGIVTLSNVEHVPRERRQMTTVAQVMTPAEKLPTASPSDNAAAVLERMEEEGVEQMPVVSAGRVIGVIGREELKHFIRIRTNYR
jgi:Zn-dependent protease/predicted transcriptional regulator